MLPSVVLLSDFGIGGSSELTGVCKSVEPDLPVYDLTHEIPKFDIHAAAAVLSDQLSAWPAGTVFVCAVDPQFGTAQRVLACQTQDGYVVVGPDNGCLGDVMRAHRVACLRELSALNQRYLDMEPSAVCHGRNLAYCGASIAAGKPPFDGSGAVCEAPEV